VVRVWSVVSEAFSEDRYRGGKREMGEQSSSEIVKGFMLG